MERVILKTSDNVNIIGDYYEGKGRDGVLLLHMMPADRKSWQSFALKLQKRGYDVLAIDLRGHGESAGGPNGYKNFSDEEHQKSILDAEAGVAFLKKQGIGDGNIILMGASIGANLVLWFLATHPEVKQGVCLSAGLNYRGIETEPLVKKLNSKQRIFFAASENDERSGGNNLEMNRRLYELVPLDVDKELVSYKSAGHGTDMFGKEKPDLASEIISWLGKKIDN